MWGLIVGLLLFFVPTAHANPITDTVVSHAQMTQLTFTVTKPETLTVSNNGVVTSSQTYPATPSATPIPTPIATLAASLTHVASSAAAPRISPTPTGSPTPTPQPMITPSPSQAASSGTRSVLTRTVDFLQLLWEKVTSW